MRTKPPDDTASAANPNEAVPPEPKAVYFASGDPTFTCREGMRCTRC